MAKEEDKPTPKETKGEWKVNLVIINEDKPPKKYLVKGDETLDKYDAMAKILNELEKLNETLLQ